MGLISQPSLITSHQASDTSELWLLFIFIPKWQLQRQLILRANFAPTRRALVVLSRGRFVQARLYSGGKRFISCHGFVGEFKLCFFEVGGCRVFFFNGRRILFALSGYTIYQMCHKTGFQIRNIQKGEFCISKPIFTLSER